MSGPLGAHARAVAARASHRVTLWREEPAYRVALRARLMRPYRVRQFGAFGEHSIVHRPTWLYGTHRIAIGNNVMFMSGAWLSVERDAWGDPEPAITVGDGCAFRAWTTLSAACRIEIGPNVVFGAGCSVVDSAHTWRHGHANVLHNPIDAAPVTIGEGTWLGDKVTVVRGARIGRRCAVGANSVVLGDVPDGSVAVGSPARVVGRSDEL